MSGPLFLTGGVAAACIVGFATLGAVALVWAEWRRPDGRLKRTRVLATLAAVGALGALALRPGEISQAGRVEASLRDVALWTGGPRSPDENGIIRSIPPNLRFRLPGANAPDGTPTVPDAGALARRVPNLGTLHIFGDGLDAGSLEGMPGGLRVSFHPGPEGPFSRFVSVFAPRWLGVGEPLSVAGRVQGGTALAAMSVGLEGDNFPSATVPLAEDGTFRVRLPGFPAPGRFGWKLRLVGADGRMIEEETGGVSVVAPELPRVLVLENAPHPDTAALRRWLGEAGGTVIVRTEVGRGRFRFTASGAGPDEKFEGLDAPLLGRFDLLIADQETLTKLPDPERGELRRAVEDRGLGVLVRASPTVSDPSPAADRTFFLPWKPEPTGDPDAAAAEADRPARLRWTSRNGEETTPEEPVPVLPFRISTPDGAVVLVRDGQARAVAARIARGRGRVGMILTQDTARWRRAGQPGAFAAFWSLILDDLAAAGAPGKDGQWSVAGGEAASGPVAWVDAPVELRWQGGEVGQTPPSARVAAEDAPEGSLPIPIPLIRDRAERTRWSAVHWPRYPGWHQIQNIPSGAALDFHVSPAGAWPGVRAWMRRQATGRFVSLSGMGREPHAAPGQIVPSYPVGLPVDSTPAAGGLFLLFVGATAFLWAEGRWVQRGPGK